MNKFDYINWINSILISLGINQEKIMELRNIVE